MVMQLGVFVQLWYFWFCFVSLCTFKHRELFCTDNKSCCLSAKCSTRFNGLWGNQTEQQYFTRKSIKKSNKKLYVCQLIVFYCSVITVFLACWFFSCVINYISDHKSKENICELPQSFEIIFILKYSSNQTSIVQTGRATWGYLSPGYWESRFTMNMLPVHHSTTKLASYVYLIILA